MSLISSRVFIRFAVSCTVASSMIGCSLATQDAAKPNTSFKVAGPQMNCVQTAAPVIQQFFNGTAKPEDVAAAWDCAGDSLTMFTNFTRGSNTDSYDAKEIRSFFETYFLGDIQINDNLLTEIMRLKQAVLGGDLTTVTRAEIARTQQIIQSLKVESLRLLPYMDLITMKVTPENGQKDPNRVESALIVFNTSMENIGNLFSQSSQVYEAQHLQNLMTELKVIYSTGGRHWDGPDTVIKYLPTITAMKAFLIKPPGNQLQPTEWQPLLVNATRLFSLYIREEYLMKSRDLLSGDGLDQFTVAVYEIFDLVQGAVQAKPNKVIEYTEWDPVVDEFLRLNLFSIKLQPKTLRDLVRIALGKVFNPPVDGTRPPVTGLSMAGLALIRDGIFGWLDMQRVWREVQAQAIAQDPKYSTAPIPVPMARDIWRTIHTPYKDAAQDIETMLNRTFPDVYTDDGSLIFGPNAKNIGYTQRAFNSLNWKTHFARVVGMGWAADPEKNRYLGVTIDEFHQFRDDMNGLTTDLEFIDPNDATIWKSTFEEANMFMLSGDANNYLSFSEGVDFISYVMSSSNINNPIYNDAKEVCPHEGEDVFHWAKINYACLKNLTVANWDKYLALLPTWQAVGKKIGPVETAKLYDTILSGARPKKPVTDALEIGDINTMTMLMHYIESIFTRFDRDQSGTISFAEARDVYPIFYPLLKDAANAGGITKESEIYALYNYILYKGKPPSSLLDKLYFKFIWCNSPSKWEKVNADRVLIAQIVGQLSATR